MRLRVKIKMKLPWKAFVQVLEMLQPILEKYVCCVGPIKTLQLGQRSVSICIIRYM